MQTIETVRRQSSGLATWVQMVVAAALAAASLAFAFGADEKPKARKGGAYHVAEGRTYNIEAHDHARLLQKYAALSDKVPGDVVQDHAAAIRFNTKGAKKSFARLAESDPDNAALGNLVEQLRERLDMVTAELELLEAQAAKNTAEAKIVIAQTNEISQHLQANHRDLRTIDNDFYDSDSDSYYMTGEGHFVD